MTGKDYYKVFAFPPHNSTAYIAGYMYYVR